MRTVFFIEIQNAPVTVNLSPFVGLNQDTIDWGDNTQTTNTYSHTYANAGSYGIIGNFQEITKINNNFTIANLNSIDISNFTSLLEIGNNFLNNCSNLKYLNLSQLTLSKIGTGFLNGCTKLEAIKLQPGLVPELLGWGTNIGTSKKMKFYCDRKSISLYTSTKWNDNTSPNHDLLSLNFKYLDGIDDEYVKSLTFNNIMFISDNTIDLSKCPTLLSAINNQNILPEESIPYSVEASTRRLYKNENLLKKSFFIYQYVYFFKDNPSQSQYNTTNYIYTRLLFAKRVYTENNIKYLEVDTFSDEVEYYDPDTYNFDEQIQNKKYYIAEAIKNMQDAHVYRYDTQVVPYQFYENPDLDYQDPPYFRSAIIFGLVDSNNLTNAMYDGEVETGFTIEIKVRGMCKNIRILDHDVNEELGRREFIKINTDKLPLGKLTAGDFILIKTKQGEKSAILERDGETIDIMKYIDRSSSWLTLHKGDNDFYAEADSGPDDGSIFNVQITIKYNNLYEGI